MTHRWGTIAISSHILYGYKFIRPISSSDNIFTALLIQTALINKKQTNNQTKEQTDPTTELDVTTSRLILDNSNKHAVQEIHASWTYCPD
jgi:hypothetical protein